MADRTLALLGGAPVITRTLEPYNSIGEEEAVAAIEVIKSGKLSGYVGNWGDGFLGGERVREFEASCEEMFGVSFAIAVNSWTSGLICAVGSIDISPGDEIIVTPFTMCATASAIVHWGGIPVFVDIDPETYCVDTSKLESKITDRTKAIISVDIFGQPADMKRIVEIASRYGIRVISDSAQSPGATFGGRYAGTLGDIGGISLNYHKHIHTGEGGILFTNDPQLANRMRLLRNHAEAIVDDQGLESIENMVGFNFRMGEIEAAIGLEQLKKLAGIVLRRQQIAQRLTLGLEGLEGLILPKVSEDSSHAFYVYPMQLTNALTNKVSRSRIVAALASEGVIGIGEGYDNLHLLPMYQKRIAYGKGGFPWKIGDVESSVTYEKGLCPVAEDMKDRAFIGLPMCLYKLDDDDVDAVVEAFRKVWSNMSELVST